MKVEVGQLWKVKKDFWSSGRSHTEAKNGSHREVKISIKKGEVIEVRYPYAWHLRTVDGWYFHIAEEKLLSRCKLWAVIDSEIRFGNRHQLKTILEEKLYTKIKYEAVVPE